jgi:hypothetical protein
MDMIIAHIRKPLREVLDSSYFKVCFKIKAYISSILIRIMVQNNFVLINRPWDSPRQASLFVINYLKDSLRTVLMVSVRAILVVWACTVSSVSCTVLFNAFYLWRCVVSQHRIRRFRGLFRWVDQIDQCKWFSSIITTIAVIAMWLLYVMGLINWNKYAIVG